MDTVINEKGTIFQYSIGLHVYIYKVYIQIYSKNWDEIQLKSPFFLHTDKEFQHFLLSNTLFASRILLQACSPIPNLSAFSLNTFSEFYHRHRYSFYHAAVFMTAVNTCTCVRCERVKKSQFVLRV